MATDNPLDVFFDLVPTGAVLYAPIFDARDELVDFRFVRLNPAAQRLLHLPAQPARTFRQQYPHSGPTGIFAQYRTAYLTGHATTYDVPYQGDGLDTYFRLVAQRSGELLVVNFTDLADLPRSAVEQSLRDSRAREQAARAEAETQRQRFYEVLMALPAQVATYHGPNHVYNFVNTSYQRYFPTQALPGRSLREVLPEAEAQGVLAVMDRVYQTGEASYQQELEVWLDFNGSGQPQQLFLNLFFHPLRDTQGRVDGLLDFSYDVTEQVQARRQVEQLNQGLEARVQERTGEVQAARAETEAQRQLLQSVLTQAPVAIGVFQGEDLVVAQANIWLCAMWGYEPAQVLGKPLLEGVPELRGQGFEDLLREVGRTRIPFTGTELPATLRQDNGELETHYFNFVYQPLYGPAGELLGVLNIATDVTTQVEARRQVEESEQQVRALVEGAPFPIGVYVGPEFHIQLANHAILEGWGKGPDVLGKRFAEVLPEFENQAVFEQLQHVLTTGQPLHLRNQQLEVVINGVPQTVYYNYSFTPLRNTQGQVYGVLNTAANVTDLVLARRRSEEAAAELRQLTAHAPAFLFRTDPTGRLTYVNDALFEWSGLDRAALASLDEAWGIKHPEDLATLQAPYGAALGAGQPWESVPYRIRRRDGQYRWSITRTQPYLNPDGTVAGHNGITLEINEQVELQRQLQRTNADLDNFIYTASHDLRAPIANVEGLLQALQHDLPAAGRVGAVPEILTLMHGAIERFKRTIAHLTDISRLQKEHSPAHQPVLLAELVEAVRLDLLPLLHESQARLTVTIPADLTVTFAEKNLRSVVYNLLSNALKYCHPDRAPHVQIRCQPQEGYQVLEVQDNGLGLNLQQGQDKLFAMFQRLHTHVEGSGIGLYMVKRMVENAGGRIEVQSELGRGSVFRVYFPG
ncbi:PAS domain-containing sensor histidine kinase [Hymenobacter sublimis]|uniref:histidine kinase n=1 Tax=Hymenobacter sublimis TaxID=2933777 RepID=A0ABY4JC97_9BACT|nr:PAS domain-containing protein [Hymenobacter sublimis]UPL50235.1 PAS domain-containing protein [Hymenobacter sublimis]